MKQKAVACALGALFSHNLYAADAQTARAELEPVLVTADRNAQTLDKAAPNVSVVSRKTLDQASAGKLSDIVLYEPGVEVPTDNNRRGSAGVNIRGITGNRILMMVDGVRIPEAYVGGGSNAATSGRDVVEPDTLRQADIVKGPYSALYGSDALGGVVNMVTYSPRDFVDAEKRGHFGLKYGYRSRDRSHGVTATAAGFHENAEGLLMITRRHGHETESMGGNKSYSVSRTASNPQKHNTYNILAKGNAGNEHHRFETLFEQYQRKNSGVMAGNFGPAAQRMPGAPVTTTTAYNINDKAKRQRLEAGYRYRGEGRLKEANITAYQQKLRSEDNSVDTGFNSLNGRMLDNPTTRHADYGFNQTIKGVNTRGVWEFDGAIRQTLTAGAEYKHAETSRPRHSTSIDTVTGAVSHTYAGSTYPNKTFPDSTRKTYSLYVQDSLTFGNSIVLTPALRYEKDKLDTTVDQAYRNANPDAAPTHFSDSALTPSLRLSVPMGENFTGFATYSQGFRTPPFDSATMAFINTTQRYEVLPNANLKSEHSNSFELGMKFKNDRAKAQVTAFYNRYKDFISLEFLGMVNGIQQTRYDNLDRVKTYGAEAAGGIKLTDSLTLNGSIAWMRGKQDDGTPLNTAYPLNGVLGLDYAQDKWGAGTKLRWSRKQSRVSSESIFKMPGYGVWDVGAWYKPSKNIEIGANIYNIGNKKYWQHGNIAGMTRSGVMDLYTETGRNYAANVQIKF